MSSDGPEGKPDELTSEDLVSVPGTMAAQPARPGLPSKITGPIAPPAPRKTAPTPPTPAVSSTPQLPPLPPAMPVGSSPAMSPPRQVEGQMIRGPRHGTLVGMGGAPRVDETERLVTGPMSPLDTQRRLVEQRNAAAAAAAAAIEERSADASAPPVASPGSPAAPPTPSTNVSPAPSIADVPPPPADLIAPSEASAQTVVHPPVAPPKPTDVPREEEKVVIDAPGAERVISEDLKETQISLRRVQLPLEGVPSGEHATVIDPARRARGRAIVAAVVGVCGLLLVVGLVVALLRRHKTDDGDTASTTSSSKTNGKPKSTSSGKAGDDDVSTSSTNGSSTTAANTGSATGAATSSAPSGAVPKGFGKLTVEPVGKTAPATALVFIGEKSYGPLGQPIFVPCGYRWIMAGVPSAKGRLATRLSKAYSVFVACGASSDTHYKLTLK
jgi:hypothetical protein